MPALATSTSIGGSRRRQRQHGRLVRHVDRRQLGAPAGGADRLDGRAPRRLVAIDDEHDGALRGEQLGDRLADAGAGAGHQRVLSVESKRRRHDNR